MANKWYTQLFSDIENEELVTSAGRCAVKSINYNFLIRDKMDADCAGAYKSLYSESRKARYDGFIYAEEECEKHISRAIGKLRRIENVVNVES